MKLLKIVLNAILNGFASSAKAEVNLWSKEYENK